MCHPRSGSVRGIAASQLVEERDRLGAGASSSPIAQRLLLQCGGQWHGRPLGREDVLQAAGLTIQGDMLDGSPSAGHVLREST